MEMNTGTADELSVSFLVEGGQPADAVMGRLTAFLAGTRKSLDLAFYDMRFGERLKQQLTTALQDRAAAGVNIRICYDGDKPLMPNLSSGQDPAPPGTGGFVQSLGYPFRRIGGMKLMHNKYIVRDRNTVWTGSTNMTEDSFSLMENNILEISSPLVADYYAQDFEQLWEKQQIEGTGDIATQPVPLLFSGAPATARVMFSPGRGLEIDAEIAMRVKNARRRIRVCSLLLNSGSLISALSDVLREKRAVISGIYDHTQMAEVYVQWEGVPQNRWKIGALQTLIAQTGLVGKNSTPYTPTGRHDFMHNKIIAVDDTVITGSYNFSRSAQLNAENVLMIESPSLAECYSNYIEQLMQKYRGDSRAAS